MTARRSFHTPEPQPVTFVELFFDLVFVFAVTQVTALTAHHLTASGILHSLLLFWLIWWAWTQFTWTLNPADTTHQGVRLVTILATGAAFVMATAVEGAFGSDAIWFAVPYLTVRVLGLALQIRVEIEDSTSNHGGVWTWAAYSVIGLGLVLAGAIADPNLRTALWVGAVVADLVAAAVAGRAREWDLNPAHISERHGLFVIIAIGESLIVAGTAVAGETRTVPLVGVAVAALAAAGLMWWSYFGWLQQALEHGLAAMAPARMGAAARDAFSLAHFPLICGIVGFAVAVEEFVAHPDEPASGAVIGALGVGVVLFVGFSAIAYWYFYRRVLVARAVALTVMVALLFVTAPLAPVLSLVVVAVTLLALVLVEGRSTERHHSVAGPVRPG